ncbi:TPA: MucB/RseB C-terminal domain-containing protein [Mannheimia haemolytica]|nr:sigma E regulator RseB [Mannheimia haemolytica serotype A2 str. OVINE]EEY11716.1 sigma E regulator RseB [Mannheimia haemolytica serotype A2 str. BOVINE]HDL5119030.1 MucB/RseB C-terminal domain-containing protein [Mannheimia haemolytica]HDL5167322.1 MucB/RseB C-terminal domain-containing protein [Mannheimia haemolytica]HDL5282288.1 MucB/RseB C-terminal domain-containing protein [Mannheimia haemolytica]
MFWVISACYTFAWAESTIKTPLAYLTAMSEAHKKSTYELVYILQQGSDTESFRLRHAFTHNKEYAQLLNLDHSREEIILKNNKVSYLGYNFRPFSLNSSQILDNLPNVLYTDYANLKGYAFLDAGKDRISDRITKVIRMKPNDTLRYAYILWIDEETHLLLKSQVLNMDNLVLEEFRVLQLYQSPELDRIANVIESLMLPTLTTVKKEEFPKSDGWQVKWLPTGFRLIQQQTVTGATYQVESEYVDSRVYSDGLSTLTIYIMPSQGVSFNEYAWQQGKLTILNQTINDRDIVIIGDVPLQSAKQIMNNIGFKEGAQP